MSSDAEYFINSGNESSGFERLLLDSILSSTEDAIVSKDLDGNILSWNLGAERLFGYAASEVIGGPISILLPPERVEEEAFILSRLRRGERIEILETERVHRTGVHIPVLLTISPIRDANGKIVGAAKIARDNTAFKRTEQELKRINEDLQQFAYSASHDLQEPLRNISILCQLLVRNDHERLSPNTLAHLDQLKDNATRMINLVEGLLNYARLGNIEGSVVPQDPNPIVTSVLRLFAPAIAERKATIVVESLPRVCVHELHLQQLFQNLISNALKYSDSNRILRISIGSQSEQAFSQFCVSDNGIGIDPQYGDYIFRFFKRLHGGDRYPGTGLGLATCRKIVEQYGGRIWVESRPGEGSTFYFTLPRVQ